MFSSLAQLLIEIIFVWSTEKLCFKAFASECKVSSGNIFAKKRKVSLGMQYFCERMQQALRMNAEFLKAIQSGMQYFCKRTPSFSGKRERK